MNSRTYEADIKECINNLNLEECKRFGLFCIDRTIKLYSSIDTRIDISEMSKSIDNGTAFTTLKSIYEKIKYNDKYLSINLSELRKKADYLIIDTDDIYDSTTKNILAKIVAEILYTLISFMITEDKSHIFDCGILVIDIINAQLSEYFYEEISKDDEYCEEYLEEFFILEYKTQLKAISLIKDKNFLVLDRLVGNTYLDCNPLTTIRNLKNKKL